MRVCRGGGDDGVEVSSGLIGRFNAMNLLQALVASSVVSGWVLMCLRVGWGVWVGGGGVGGPPVGWNGWLLVLLVRWFGWGGWGGGVGVRIMRRPMRRMRLRRCVMLLVLGEVGGGGGFVLSLVVVGIVIG